jgi:hypothetical protein
MSNTPDPISAVLASIRHWHNKANLAQFAIEGHGFGNTDGGFGITYPRDLDVHDREVEHVEIPAGYVLVYGFWGDEAGGYHVLVAEAEYRRILAEELERLHLPREAAMVRKGSLP